MSNRLCEASKNAPRWRHVLRQIFEQIVVLPDKANKTNSAFENSNIPHGRQIERKHNVTCKKRPWCGSAHVESKGTRRARDKKKENKKCLEG